MDNQPEQPENPEAKARRNHFICDSKNDCLSVVIYLDANDSAQKGLGTLEMAKDMLKNMLIQKAQRDAQDRARNGLLIPGQRKNGGMSVH